ncbi:MAG: phenylalanine--tRNA ligase subunit alpha [Candidatus Pacebacteria bacterium]|nr:phenylalanine--tRNA ligase subunit alpha [Candidatus Paceibacterota bacterium]
MSEGKNTYKNGSLHPLTLVINEAVGILSELGFEVATGPELEDQWHNFDALNVPKDHPARDMQDTFFIKESEPEKIKEPRLLRTHTSPGQIRYMENHKPPLAIVVPGKVFRNEATDAYHEMQFYQIEGLMVGEDISMAHLKGVLLEFFKKFLSPDVKIRLRPSFFPFVEPGLEVDVFYNNRWIEVLGAGMVHPKVLENARIDSTKYQGFAFGMGADRLMVIKYGVSDIRLSYQGDLRFNQF